MKIRFTERFSKEIIKRGGNIKATPFNIDGLNTARNISKKEQFKIDCMYEDAGIVVEVLGKDGKWYNVCDRDYIIVEG